MSRLIMELCFRAWASFFFCELPSTSVERPLCLILPSYYSVFVCTAPIHQLRSNLAYFIHHIMCKKKSDDHCNNDFAVHMI